MGGHRALPSTLNEQTYFPGGIFQECFSYPYLGPRLVLYEMSLETKIRVLNSDENSKKVPYPSVVTARSPSNAD